MNCDAEIDKRLKNEAIDYIKNNLNILIEYRDYKRAKFKGLDSGLLYHNFLEKYGQKGLLGCSLLMSRHYQRVKRISDRIENIVLDAYDLENGLYFLTFTFSDDYLSKTTFSYRRKLIQRLLKKYCWHYVANIDYGQDEKFTQREHYHAFVETSYLKKLKDRYYEITKSYLHAKSYRDKKRSTKYIGNYVIKLVNHSVKDSTENTRVIFDRNCIWSTSVLDKKEHQQWVYEQEHKECIVVETPEYLEWLANNPNYYDDDLD